MRLMYRLAIVLADTLCAVAGLAIWFLITGQFTATGVRILGSTLVVSLCTVAGLVGATVLDRPHLRRALGAITLLLGCGHACVMLGRLRRSDGSIVLRLSKASVAFGMLGALLVAGGFAFAARDVGTDFWRVLGVLAVLSTLTTLLAPIVRRLGHRLPEMHIA
jgi:hypothetical protein